MERVEQVVTETKIVTRGHRKLDTAEIQKALIIGGGIAGPACALALRKAGIDATVYEAYADPADDVGSALSVAPNGIDALALIGVSLEGLGQPNRRQVIADGNGKQLFEFRGVPGLPPSRVLWRGELSGALREHAEASGIQYQRGKRLVGAEEAPDGITAVFGDGSRATGDILIGADGIRSTVRTLIDPEAPNPEYVGLLGFAGCATGSGVTRPSDTQYFVFGKRAFMGYWSEPNGGVVWFSNLPSEQPLPMAEARGIPTTEWLRRFREVYADDVPGRTLVAHTRPDQLFVLGAMDILPRVPHWYRGRMVLVGDAVHAPSSSSGQGASLAIESAVELARCLRDLPDRAEAFATYERLRRPRVERVAAMAAKTNNRKAAGPITKMLMSALMPIATRTVLKPEKMFGWMHRYHVDWDRRTA